MRYSRDVTLSSRHVYLFDDARGAGEGDREGGTRRSDLVQVAEMHDLNSGGRAASSSFVQVVVVSQWPLAVTVYIEQ